jgi:hypothetical protein
MDPYALENLAKLAFHAHAEMTRPLDVHAPWDVQTDQSRQMWRDIVALVFLHHRCVPTSVVRNGKMA